MRKLTKFGCGIAVLGVLISSSPAGANAANKPTDSVAHQIYVGDHLHTMSVMGNRLFMTGHDSAGMSDDGGRSWNHMATLDGADVMSWATTSTMILAGGHSGLFTSTNKGLTFKRITFFGSTSDVHAIGSSGKYVYLGSPQVGLLMSSDGGRSWTMRNSKIGQSFMGSMLVDPKNPKRIIAPDMSTGLAVSSDAGLTWELLGGPAGPMAVAWNPKNRNEIASIGMMTGGFSLDGGKSWKPLHLPSGAAALDYSKDGKKLVVGVLSGNMAQVFTSSDHGKSWQTPSTTVAVKQVAAMDPNMPGMNHTEVAPAKRPLAMTLGTFGFGTSSVFITALVMRRRDRAKLTAKKSTHSARDSSK
jgi:photosystem II stability/assembly factor-like uncharacterized protein